MADYYTITNKDEIHNGYKYKDGLNILEEFNENINDDCCKGGFYFTTAEYIHELYEFGENLRVVELPLDNPNFKMVELNKKFKANMIILKEKYNFNNLNDFKKIYYININYNYNICNIEILEWLKNINYSFNSEKIIKNSSKNGYVNVLEWFKNNNYKFKYNAWTIKEAAENGHVDVLEWFKNSGYKFTYNEYAIFHASQNGHVHVLEWFKNSGYEFKYDKNAINYASMNGHIHILEWFKNSGLEFKYSEDAIMRASLNGHINVLEWFKNNMNYTFYYNLNNKNLNKITIEWLKINGVEFIDNPLIL
jgi:hypothetical protein